MGDGEHGGVAEHDLPDTAEDPRLHRGVQAGRGLVEDKQLGVLCEDEKNFFFLL